MDTPMLMTCDTLWCPYRQPLRAMEIGRLEFTAINRIGRPEIFTRYPLIDGAGDICHLCEVCQSCPPRARGGSARTFLLRLLGSSWLTLDDRNGWAWDALSQRERWFVCDCSDRMKAHFWRDMEMQFKPLFGGIAVRYSKKQD